MEPCADRSPTAPELLRRKRAGAELSPAELRWWCEQVVAGGVQDCQIGAMLMAMYIQGMSHRETVELTRWMVETGERLRWDPSWPVADKHSTGGVGDKVSLVLAPALASFGLKVPMMTGRGLGHTGGTLDKLESIPVSGAAIAGYRVRLSEEEMAAALETAGCFMAGPTERVAPADAIFYRVRDVTATVDSIPLVVGSILSKKIAEGTKLLVMDIKVGRAAFFKTLEEATELARELMSVGAELGVSTRAVLTEMDCPIGLGIGNALEVEEAVACLRGRGSEDLVELVAVCGEDSLRALHSTKSSAALALQQAGQCGSLDEGAAAARESLSNGEALKRFRSMLACQGVSEAVAEQLCFGDAAQVLPSVPRGQVTAIPAPGAGIVKDIDAMAVGEVVWSLGGGRASSGADVDRSVGVRLLKRRGQAVAAGEPWAEVHHAESALKPELRAKMEAALALAAGEPAGAPTRIIEVL